MAKRDPNKTARNKRITAMKERLRELLPKVLKETGLDSENLFADGACRPVLTGMLL